MTLRFLALGGAAGLALLVACGPESPVAAVPPSSATSASLLPVTIRTAGGDRLFSVEIARTEAEQARGLMYRTSLPPGGGMLFPFATPRPAGFWMKNTVIPLDMIFIRADGSIARIAENTVPYSLDVVESGEPVAAVLEIAGGASAEAGIAEGDRASWPGGPR